MFWPSGQYNFHMFSILCSPLSTNITKNQELISLKDS